MADVQDNPELEALFDSIVAAQAPAVAVSPQRPAGGFVSALSEGAGGQGDSADLEALFDSVSAQRNGAASALAAQGSVAPAGSGEPQDRAFNRIGQLARQLHDAMVGLGYDKVIEKTVHAIPDAKDRLAYVANLTEQAACRVLNATDIAMPIQERMDARRKEIAGRWDRLYANQLSVAEFRALADETRAFLNGELPEGIAQTNAQLMEIMMAQDFQDLTGQVIKKIVVLAQEMEVSIVSALIDIIPEIRKTEEVNSLLNGPVISADGRPDVVVGQQQVDDLLGSLGF
jgi:chemotaxis protein CheZ